MVNPPENRLVDYSYFVLNPLCAPLTTRAAQGVRWEHSSAVKHYSTGKTQISYFKKEGVDAWQCVLYTNLLQSLGKFLDFLPSPWKHSPNQNAEMTSQIFIGTLNIPHEFWILPVEQIEEMHRWHLLTLTFNLTLQRITFPHLIFKLRYVIFVLSINPALCFSL